jgi:hypothetical protein
VKILAAILMASGVAFADSSLTFGAATSNRVSHGSSSGVDALGRTGVMTIASWVYPTTITAGRGIANIAVDSGGPSNAIRFVYNSGSGDWRCRVLENNNSASNTTTATGNSVVNRWQFVSCVYDTNASSNTRIYTAYSGQIVSDRTSSATNGTDVLIATHSSRNYWTGNNSADEATPILSFQGQIGWTGVWNRALTLDELQEQMLSPNPTRDCVIFTYYGANGNGTQIDLTGNGNSGTGSGTTASLNGPPIFLQGGPR